MNVTSSNSIATLRIYTATLILSLMLLDNVHVVVPYFAISLSKYVTRYVHIPWQKVIAT